MAYQTNEEIRVDIAGLTERIRQHRIQQGLPPEPKRIEPFVSVPISLMLLERLQPLVRITVKYTALLAAGTLHRIDTASFAEYREYAGLLRCSRGMWCRWAASGFRTMFGIIEQINSTPNEDVDLPDAVRKAHFAIKMMRHDTSQDTYDFTSGKAYEGLIAIRTEIDRLNSDPAAFQAEYDAALEQYELIGEDDEIE